MLAKIEDFLFDLNGNDIATIQHRFNFEWSRKKRIANHQYTQRNGLWEEAITFSGKLLLQSVDALKAFEDLAKEQRPVRLTLGTGESYEVVIDGLSRVKSGFLKDGKYRYQEYSISMTRYFS